MQTETELAIFRERLDDYRNVLDLLETLHAQSGEPDCTRALEFIRADLAFTETLIADLSAKPLSS